MWRLIQWSGAAREGPSARPSRAAVLQWKSDYFRSVRLRFCDRHSLPAFWSYGLPWCKVIVYILVNPLDLLDKFW